MIKLLLLFLFPLIWSQEIIKAQDSASICRTPNNTMGQCIPFNKCAELSNFVKINGNNPTSVKLVMMKYQCSVGNDARRVCCPSNTVASTNTEECGRVDKKLIDKVAGGKEAFLGDYPWMAALGYKTFWQSTESFQWSCGGALISSQYVLTAAHCILYTRTMKLYKVRLGVADLNTTDDQLVQPVDRLIESTKIHENYSGKPKVENDVALIKLKEKVSYNAFIRPICLPLLSQFRKWSMVGEDVYIAGWGRLRYDGPFSPILQHAKVPIVKLDDCKTAYTPMGATVDHRNLCAGYSEGGIDSCQGDSGGPLMWRNESEGKYYTVGVVSFGHKKCASQGFPGVYTNIAEFTEFIVRNME